MPILAMNFLTNIINNDFFVCHFIHKLIKQNIQNSLGVENIHKLI